MMSKYRSGLYLSLIAAIQRLCVKSPNQYCRAFSVNVMCIMLVGLATTGKVESSTPGRAAVTVNDLEQVVHTRVPLSPSSIIWYLQSRGSDVLRLGR